MLLLQSIEARLAVEGGPSPPQLSQEKDGQSNFSVALAFSPCTHLSPAIIARLDLRKVMCWTGTRSSCSWVSL